MQYNVFKRFLRHLSHLHRTSYSLHLFQIIVFYLRTQSSTKISLISLLIMHKKLLHRNIKQDLANTPKVQYPNRVPMNHWTEKFQLVNSQTLPKEMKSNSRELKLFIAKALHRLKTIKSRKLEWSIKIYTLSYLSKIMRKQLIYSFQSK